MIAILILFYTHWKGSEISYLYRNEMKPDIRPDTGYPVQP